MEGKGKGVIRTCHEPGEESIEDGKGFEPANRGILGGQIRQKRLSVSERSKEERYGGSKCCILT